MSSAAKSKISIYQNPVTRPASSFRKDGENRVRVIKEVEYEDETPTAVFLPLFGDSNNISMGSIKFDPSLQYKIKRAGPIIPNFAASNFNVSTPSIPYTYGGDMSPSKKLS